MEVYNEDLGVYENKDFIWRNMAYIILNKNI